MPRKSATYRRVDLPVALYEDVAKDADGLHMPVATLIISTLARGLANDRARASIPMRDRSRPHNDYTVLEQVTIGAPVVPDWEPDLELGGQADE